MSSPIHLTPPSHQRINLFTLFSQFITPSKRICLTFCRLSAKPSRDSLPNGEKGQKKREIVKEREEEELLIHEWKLEGEKKEDNVPPVWIKPGFPARGTETTQERGEKGRRRRSSERKGQRGWRGRRQSFVHSRTVHLPLTERIKGIRSFRGLNAPSSSLLIVPSPSSNSRALSSSSPLLFYFPGGCGFCLRASNT